jgi:glycosyltransferase involved in cell wall biosynthesis
VAAPVRESGKDRIVSRRKQRARISVIEVCNSRQAWGAEFAVMALAGPLAERGVDLVLASPMGGDLPGQWEKLGFRHIPLDIPTRQGVRASDGDSGAGPGQLVKELGTTLRTVRRIAKAAKEGDVINSSSLWTHFDCALAGRLARRPVVLDMHDIVRPGVGRKLLTAAVRLSAASIAVSQAVADCVGPAGARNLRIMVPAVELDRFHPGPPDPTLRQLLTSSVDDPLVGIVGRIDPEKGVHLVVEAVAALQGPAARAHLAVIGSPGFDSGAYLDRLKADGARLLGDRARFPGRLDDVPACLRACDVVVNASMAEPFGLSILEAQASGTPVVATRSGGVTDYLTDGDNALLVPCDDSVAMSAALDRVLTDPELAARLSYNGRALAEAGHGIDGFADDLAVLYRRLANHPPSKVGAEPDR